MDSSHLYERILVRRGEVREIAFCAQFQFKDAPYRTAKHATTRHDTTRRDMTGPNMTREEMT